MGITSIEWTDRSVNPIRASRTIIAGNGYEIEDVKVGHYCEMISPGCAHCYSSRSSYSVLPEQPEDQTMRSTDAWRAWATERGEVAAQ